MRRRALFVVAAVLALLLAVPSAASADPPPVLEVTFDCDGDMVTAVARAAFLWVPGHVTSNDEKVTHIVTSIFGFEKGQTNGAPGIAPRLVECTVVNGPPGPPLVVTGFFVPGGPPA